MALHLCLIATPQPPHYPCLMAISHHPHLPLLLFPLSQLSIPMPWSMTTIHTTQSIDHSRLAMPLAIWPTLPTLRTSSPIRRKWCAWPSGLPCASWKSKHFQTTIWSCDQRTARLLEVGEPSVLSEDPRGGP